MADPLSDARRRLDARFADRGLPPLLVVIGLGAGQLLTALDERNADTRVLALEPDASAAAAFLASGAGRRWLESGRLVYFAGPDYRGVEEAWRMFPGTPGGFQLLVDPAIEQQPTPSAVEALRRIKQIASGAAANTAARREFAPRYLLNTLRNLPALAAGHDVRLLADAYRGVPAVVAAAGPSLDDAVADLREVQQHVLLIAVDTAARPLIAQGVQPHLAVGLDPSEINARHYHGLPECRGMWLAAEPSLDPTAVQPFIGRTLWFRVGPHQPWPWFGALGIDVGALEVWGSVVTAAFQLAIVAGCDPIVLVGADLSYTGGRPYCRGTTYEFETARQAGSGAPPDSWWQWLQRAPTREVPDLHGAPTRATDSLLSFRDWLTTRIPQSGRRVVNATGNGILSGPGIEQGRLRDVVDSRGIVMFPPAGERPPSRLAPNLLAQRVEELRRASTAVPGVAQQWAELVGDWGAVDAVLTESARGLSGSPSPADGSLLPPTPVSAHGALPWLPEALARWQRLVSGDDPGLLPAATHHRTPDAWLADALALLGALRGSLTTADTDVEPPWITGLPLSAAAPIPGPLRWPLLLFDALLGTAANGPLGRVVETFFSLPTVPVDGAPAGERREHFDLNVLLAVDWVIAARSLLAPGAEHQCAAAACGIELQQRQRASADGDAVLVLAMGGQSVRLPLGVGQSSLARVLTGTFDLTPDVAAPLGLPGGGASIVFGDVPTPREAFRAIPRVLSDHGVPRASIVYTTDAGAVCVSAGSPETFVIDAHGAIASRRRWPSPVIGELPFGAGGVVAWDSGVRDGRQLDSGLVMYQADAASPVVRVTLPFRPLRGVWWNERLYWTCFPSGIGSWRPGEPPVFDCPDKILIGIAPDGDSLLLMPMARDEQGARIRVRATEGWRWRPDMAPVPVALGAEGAPSARVIGTHGWEAVAYPEADVIHCERPGHPAVRLACYYPGTLAWLGRSLLVTTMDGEILLFADLADHLDRAVAGTPNL